MPEKQNLQRLTKPEIPRKTKKCEGYATMIKCFLSATAISVVLLWKNIKELVNKSGLSDTFFIDSGATSREEIGNPVHYGTGNKLEKVGIY